MIKFDIVYGHSIKLIHGVNFVTDMFVKGKGVLNKEGVDLRHIYHDSGRLECSNINSITTLQDNNNQPKRNRIKKFIIDFLKSKNIVFEFLRFYFRHMLPAKKTINNYIKYNDSDCILFQDFITAYYYFKNKKIEHKKTILLMHTSGNFLDFFMIEKPTLYKYHITRQMYLKMFNFAASNVDKVVVLSKVAFDSFPFIPELRKKIIYNGISELVNEKETIFLNNYDEKKINLICVANLIERKGQDILIKAVHNMKKKYIKKINLYLVGGGCQYNYYKQMIDDYNLNNTIFLLGQRKDVASLLSKMDIFILPSESEGLPISIIEALRAGLYIMVTDVGGCKELIKPNFGELIDRDIVEISKSLEKRIDEGIPSDTKLKSKQFFNQKFTLEKMMRNYAEVIKEI